MVTNLQTYRIELIVESHDAIFQDLIQFENGEKNVKLVVKLQRK